MPLLSLLNPNPQKQFILGLVEKLNILRREVNEKYALRPSVIKPLIEAAMSEYLAGKPLSEQDCMKMIKYFIGLPDMKSSLIPLRAILKRDPSVKEDIFKQLETQLICPFDQVFLNYIASLIHEECYLKLPADSHEATVKDLAKEIEATRAIAWEKEIAGNQRIIQQQAVGFLQMMKDHEIKQAELSAKALEIKVSEARLDEETRRFQLDQIVLAQAALLNEHQANLAERAEKLSINKEALAAEADRIKGGPIRTTFVEQLKLSLDFANTAIAELKNQQRLLASELRQMFTLQTESIKEQLEAFKAMQLNTNHDLKELINKVNLELSTEQVKANKALHAQLNEVHDQVIEVNSKLINEGRMRDEEQARLQAQYHAIASRFEAFDLSSVKVDDFLALRNSHNELINSQQLLKIRLEAFALHTEGEFAVISSRLSSLEALPAAVISLSRELSDVKLSLLKRIEVLEAEQLHIKAELAVFKERLLASEVAKLPPDFVASLIEKQLKSYLLKRSLFHPALEGEPLWPKDYDIKLCDLIFSEKIGQGSFGLIFKGMWQAQTVAIKQIEGIISAKERAQFIREATIMSRLHSEYIVHFYGACIEPDNMCLVMAFMEKGSLEKVLPSLSWPERLKMAQDLAKGLCYLHAKDLIHTHIHPGNVLINSLNQAKWSEFSLSKTAYASVKSVASRTSQFSACLAPERMSLYPHISKASDIYSFGVLLWSLVTGKLPYQGMKEAEIITAVKTGYRESLKDMPEECARIIESCWHADPAKRPGAIEVERILSSISLRPSSPSADSLYEQAVEAHKAHRIGEAYAFFERAASKGNVKAHVSLGTMALRGEGGMPPNKAQAIRAFEFGVSHGHARAMYCLARMYEEGDGILTDLSKALALYRDASAADPGKEEYKRKVTLLSARVGPSLG